jgi:site-specific DNA-methyltransferase (adenine-specific)
MTIRLFQADALEIMRNSASCSIDLIVTDPPYASLEKHRASGTTTRMGGNNNPARQDDDKFFPTVGNDYLYRCMAEWYRLLRQDRHCWVMCDNETMVHLMHWVYAGRCAFSYAKAYPVIKRARTGGYRQGMGYHGRCSHEYAVLFEKGRRRFTEENWPDVFEVVWDGDSVTRPFTHSGKAYPTAKPVALYRRLIELSSLPNEKVLDPFAGSGTCAVAGRELGRRVLLIDSQDKAIKTMQARFDSLGYLYESVCV